MIVAVLAFALHYYQLQHISLDNQNYNTCLITYSVDQSAWEQVVT